LRHSGVTGDTVVLLDGHVQVDEAPLVQAPDGAPIQLAPELARRLVNLPQALDVVRRQALPDGAPADSAARLKV